MHRAAHVMLVMSRMRAIASALRHRCSVSVNDASIRACLDVRLD